MKSRVPESLMDRAKALLAGESAERIAAEPKQTGGDTKPATSKRRIERRDIPTLAASAYGILGAIAIIICSIALGLWIGVFGGVLMLAAFVGSGPNWKK